MLSKLSQSAHSVFAKILLGLLVLSFGYWGIADVMHQSVGTTNVATVDGTGITSQQFQSSYQQQLDVMRQRLGSKYSSEMMRKFGMDQIVLEQLIINLLVEKQTQSLGLEAGDDAVAEKIESMESFQGENGHFDTDMYLNTLKRKNISEKQYVSDLRKDIAAQLLDNTLTGGVVPPEELVQALYKIRNEQRIADLLVIPLSQVKQVPSPSDKEIKEYYDAHGKDYSAPEYRTVSYIVMKESDLKTSASVSEDEIKRTYEEHAQDYHEPEQRTVQQLMFDNDIDANKAEDQLRHGASFADVAQGSTVMNKGRTELGPVSKKQLPSEVADAVFALKVNEYTKPLHTEFGWHILRVSKIEPEHTPTLAEVHAAIAKDLAEKQSQELMNKQLNALDDDMAGGATLEAAAQKVGIKTQTFGPVTREGISPEGKKLTIPAYDGFMNVAFSTNEKDHSQALQSGDNIYFLLRVDNVQPEHVRALSEVRNQVVAAWSKQKKNELLAKLADDVAAQLQHGKSLSDIEAAYGITINTIASGPLKRVSETIESGPLSKQALPHGLIPEIFQNKMGVNTHAFILADGDAIIAVPKQDTPAPEVLDNSESMNAIRNELKDNMAKEVLYSYLGYLNGKYHVVRNNLQFAVPDDQNGQ